MTSSQALSKVLVVEDDADVLDLIALTLGTAGHAVLRAGDGAEAFDRLAADAPDLVVLDLMLPAISGIEVLQHIRQRSAAPVIVVSALGDEDHRVRALELGADDYVTKPFSPRELAARVDAVLRRSNGSIVQTTIAYDGLVVDVGSRDVWVRGVTVETTAKEFDLLAFLASNPGRVYTRHQLLGEVWHSSSEWQQEGTVTEHIRRLRSKIEDDPERPRWLQTVRGVGYRFDRRRSTQPADLEDVA